MSIEEERGEVLLGFKDLILRLDNVESRLYDLKSVDRVLLVKVMENLKEVEREVEALERLVARVD